MEDLSRCFPVPPLPAPTPAPDLPRYEAAIHQLASNCWAHYEDGNAHHRSLYVGSLGPCAYVRYKLAQSLSWEDAREKKLQLLNAASQAANIALQSEGKGHRTRVTLLEGERVGALALLAAIHHSLQAVGESNEAEFRAKNELLGIGNDYVWHLPEAGECEVLYGSAGYLHAIAFVRSETNDEKFGTRVVQKLVKGILKNGKATAREYRALGKRHGVPAANAPLMWEWHGTAYLGAIHGVAGILFTLLCFYGKTTLIDGAIDKIKATIAKLDEMCLPSGNLASSLGKLGKEPPDKLVHLCHGCPGHILLLAKAYEVLDEERYLARAEQIAANVLCRRGLLRKGVGLCHGISGNAYCFLSLYRGRKLAEQRTGDVKHAAKCRLWLAWAVHFAKFALDNLNELYGVPDCPHSLYEGSGGLIMLLHDLRDPERSRFPCFEH